MSSKYKLAACSLVRIARGRMRRRRRMRSRRRTPPAPPEDTLFFLQNVAPLPAFGGRIDILRSEGGVPGPVVKGKPYSARSITESTQTLADGNRIAQRNEAVIYRDSEGRTRREQTLSGVGPWQAGEPVTMINIHDPVAGKSYVLDPAARIAREIRPFQMAIAHAQEIEGAKAGLEASGRSCERSVNGAVPAPAPARRSRARRSGTVTVIRRADGGAERPGVCTARVGAVVPFPQRGRLACTSPPRISASKCSKGCS